MSTEIQKRETVLPEVRSKILQAINRGYVNTAEDIAELYPNEITEEQAVELLNEDEFYLQIANGTRARMRILYNTKGVQLLEDLLDSRDNKDRIAGYDRLAKATGGIQEEKQGVNNFNFFNIEDLLEAKEKREKVIDVPKKDFNRVKIRNAKQDNLPIENINGNIFENESDEDETVLEDSEYDLESMFEESEELEFDD